MVDVPGKIVIFDISDEFIDKARSVLAVFRAIRLARFPRAERPSKRV